VPKGGKSPMCFECILSLPDGIFSSCRHHLQTSLFFLRKKKEDYFKTLQSFNHHFLPYPSQKEKEVCKQINGKLMLAHPPEKRAPVIYKIKKDFQTQENNKKK